METKLASQPTRVGDKGTCEKIVGGQLANADEIAKHMKEMEKKK